MRKRLLGDSARSPEARRDVNTQEPETDSSLHWAANNTIGLNAFTCKPEIFLEWDADEMAVWRRWSGCSRAGFQMHFAARALADDEYSTGTLASLSGLTVRLHRDFAHSPEVEEEQDIYDVPGACWSCDAPTRIGSSLSRKSAKLLLAVRNRGIFPRF